MKPAGIIRHVDRLGRVVLPGGLRKEFHIESFCDIEIWADGDKVIITKYVPSCVICDKEENTVTFREKTICRNCVTALQTHSDSMAIAVNL